MNKEKVKRIVKYLLNCQDLYGETVDAKRKDIGRFYSFKKIG